jgi:hypothetical protein
MGRQEVRRLRDVRDDHLLTKGQAFRGIVAAQGARQKKGPLESGPKELPEFGQAREESVPMKHSHRSSPVR